MSNDGGNNKSDADSTYYQKQMAGKKTGSTYEVFKDGKSQGIDYGVKKSVENYKAEQFKNSGKIEGTIKTPFMLLNLGLNAGKDLLNKGSVKTREFFSNKVLTSKRAKKNIGYTQAEFRSLSVDKQNEIYSSYIEGRLSNKTDAYGNDNPGYNKGGDGQNQVRKTEKQIETESEEETKKDQKTEEEKEEDYKKVKGLKGARSMFGNAGGRGYFDPAK
jgi:hypothetical protein